MGYEEQKRIEAVLEELDKIPIPPKPNEKGYFPPEPDLQAKAYYAMIKEDLKKGAC